jgi:glycosyltransferase involved in cell wall biosynthesis
MNIEGERNVLLITYLFPPLGGSGALRALKLAKYLPSFGWRPIILTARNPDFYYASDPGLLKELPPKVMVNRSFMIRTAWVHRILNPLRIPRIDRIISRLFVHPDDQVGWVPFAYFSAIRIIREQNIRVIYSTSGPLSCHIIAYLVKRRTGITWVAEFRDEWFEDPKRNFATEFHRRLHYKLEGTIVNNADRIITMAPVFSSLLSKHAGNPHKFTTILAGFDPDDFTDRYIERRRTNKRRFITTFVGLFYNTFRPASFLKALEELVDEGKLDPREIKVRFVGPNSPGNVGMEDVYGICEFMGFVPRKRALEHVSEAHLLLLLLSKERGEDIIPSKVFEYMASGKPILALIPSNGHAASIIRKTKSGIVADFDNVNEIKRAYLGLYRQWKEKEDILIETDWDEVATFDQKMLTRELADTLDREVGLQ